MTRAEDFSILLVENNEDHAEVTLRAIEHATGLTNVFWVKDGEEALDFLHRRREYAEPAPAPRPGLIILDLKLPKVGGHDVLRRVKTDAALLTIPVVMLSTSIRETDVAESYRLGADGFVRKPTHFAELVERVRAMDALKPFTTREEAK